MPSKQPAGDGGGNGDSRASDGGAGSSDGGSGGGGGGIGSVGNGGSGSGGTSKGGAGAAYVAQSAPPEETLGKANLAAKSAGGGWCCGSSQRR